MAIRTTAAEVKEIIPTNLTTTQVDPYITTASLIVDENIADCGLSDEVLEQIEMWLTAHLIAMTADRQTKSEKVGEAQVTYYDNFGKSLNSTSYGKVVAMLDTCNVLSDIGKKTIKTTVITSFET